MKNLSILTLLAILLVSCAPGPTPVPVSTVTDTPFPTSTFTPEPTATSTPELTKTQTVTPKPTATPLRLLTPQDVILPVKVIQEYALAHFWTGTTFHAGDMIYPYIGPKHDIITVYAPTDGVVTGYMLIPNVGGEIRVTSNFICANGKKASWDIVHFDTLREGIVPGQSVKQGDEIGYITKPHVGTWRQEWVLDFAIRCGPRGPNPNFDPFYPGSYIAPFPFVEDDIQSQFPNAYLYKNPDNTNPIPLDKQTPLPSITPNQ